MQLQSASEFFTLGNLITWAICAVLLWMSLNFRVSMIFRHPGRKRKEDTIRRAAKRKETEHRQNLLKALSR